MEKWKKVGKKKFEKDWDIPINSLILVKNGQLDILIQKNAYRSWKKNITYA